MCESISEIHKDLSELGTTVYVQGSSTETLPAGLLPYDELFETASDAPVPVSERAGVKLLDCMCYIYTSGTTGRPTWVFHEVNFTITKEQNTECCMDGSIH